MMPTNDMIKILKNAPLLQMVVGSAYVRFTMERLSRCHHAISFQRPKEKNFTVVCLNNPSLGVKKTQQLDRPCAIARMMAQGNY